MHFSLFENSHCACFKILSLTSPLVSCLPCFGVNPLLSSLPLSVFGLCFLQAVSPMLLPVRSPFLWALACTSSLVPWVLSTDFAFPLVVQLSCPPSRSCGFAAGSVFVIVTAPLFNLLALLSFNIHSEVSPLLAHSEMFVSVSLWTLLPPASFTTSHPVFSPRVRASQLELYFLVMGGPPGEKDGPPHNESLFLPYWIIWEEYSSASPNPVCALLYQGLWLLQQEACPCIWGFLVVSWLHVVSSDMFLGDVSARPVVLPTCPLHVHPPQLLPSLHPILFTSGHMCWVRGTQECHFRKWVSPPESVFLLSFPELCHLLTISALAPTCGPCDKSPGRTPAHGWLEPALQTCIPRSWCHELMGGTPCRTLS